MAEWLTGCRGKISASCQSSAFTFVRQKKKPNYFLLFGFSWPPSSSSFFYIFQMYLLDVKNILFVTSNRTEFEHCTNLSLSPTQAVCAIFEKSVKTLLHDFAPMVSQLSEMLGQMYSTIPQASALDLTRQVHTLNTLTNHQLVLQIPVISAQTFPI